MEKEGVCVFENLITPEKIQTLSIEIQRIREIVMAKVNTMDRPLKVYSDIAERHLGRLDYRCGFTAEIFQQVAEPIIHIIKQMSPTINFKHFWGAIPALGGSGATDFHRDVYSLMNYTQGVNLDPLDIFLPAYYFTVLIPLVNITEENGPTQFIKASHLKPVVDTINAEIFNPLLKLGDATIFDGRTMHKGSANHTKDERLVAYITFVANWYHDQTFEVNDYLFPELSVRGI
jgi:ectoine hydroxylase-related dioxygenase (phytanoyl-CoA dioxygenase family)